MEKIIGRKSKEKLDAEKIDEDAVLLMSDEELKEYVPSHGDRVRLKHYLRRTRDNFRTETKKQNLLSVLRQKIEGVRETNFKRKLSITEDDEEEEKNMRANKGQTGNRHASKNDRRIEKGWINKMGTLSKQVRFKQGGGTRKIRIHKGSTKEDILRKGKELFFPNGISTKGPETQFKFDVWDFKDQSLEENVTVGALYEETKVPLLRFYVSTTEKTEDTASLPDPVDKNSTNILVQAIIETDVPMNDSEDETMQAADNVHTSVAANETETRPRDNDTASGGPATDIIFDTAVAVNAIENIEIPHNDTQLLRLHRGHVLKELINAYKTIDPFTSIVNIEMLMPNGEPEAAEDNGGVSRDALAEFWKDFYAESTLGSSYKVPFLRHDYGENEWISVARVIVYGFRQFGYFPVLLSLPFMEQCLYGEVRCNLMDEFMGFILESEASTLRKAVSDMKGLETEELLDVLEHHEVKVIPTQDNIERIIQEISHKELIQTSMYIIDCWAPVLKRLYIDIPLAEIYSKLKPTPRRVLQKLAFPEIMSAEESVTSNHLKRFVRELDNSMITKFLRFCSGSDLLVCEKIEVSFVNVTGLARRPVAHTCSCLLELPKIYENFPQFRTEFLHILNSNIWVMDII